MTTSEPPRPDKQARAKAKAKENLDRFELAVAVLIGLATICGAWSGHQAERWSGTSETAYETASDDTTKAATIYQLGVSIALRDEAVEILAKRKVFEGTPSRDKSLTLAAYLYSRVLSREAFQALGLPPEYFRLPENELHKIPKPALEKALSSHMGDAYIDRVLKRGRDAFAAAEKKFEEGRSATSNRSRFSLAVVFFALCLFMGGLALVFKSKVKWAFYTCGAVLYLFSLGYMLTLPITHGALPQDHTHVDEGGTTLEHVGSEIKLRPRTR